MPVKIHHGPPGAYKTSGAVNDDFIKWAQQGRIVVTNVRGLNSAREFRKNYKNTKTFLQSRYPKYFKQPPIPRSFKLLYLDTELSVNREKMREWFMWAPKGCAFLIDEIQTIYPQTMTAKEYKDICYQTAEDAKQAERPETLHEAFEKHRHYNWDFVVTAPSIKKVPPIIRDISETAFIHNNKAKMGFKGMYLEAMHNPADSGLSESHWIGKPMFKRAPKRVFKLYASTDTGETKDTEAGRNIFLQPQVIATVFFVFVFALFLTTRGNPLKAEVIENAEIQEDKTQEEENEQTKVAKVRNDVHQLSTEEIRQRRSKINSNRGRNLSTTEPVSDTGILAGFEITIGGVIDQPFIYASLENIQLELNSDELRKHGYTIEEVSRCMWIIRHQQFNKVIHCEPTNDSDNSGPLRSIISNTQKII